MNWRSKDAAGSKIYPDELPEFTEVHEVTRFMTGWQAAKARLTSGRACDSGGNGRVTSRVASLLGPARTIHVTRSGLEVSTTQTGSIPTHDATGS